jgi:hypothetical protein
MTQQSKICALRTGNQWSSGTRMRIEVGNSGKIIGAGGNGGTGGSAVATGPANAGGDGGDGSGALGIEYGTDSNPTIVRVKSSGRIIGMVLMEDQTKINVMLVILQMMD